jgi:hypothetical protein
MPRFNIPVADIFEDVDFLKMILGNSEELKLASGYLNLPD